MQRGADVPLQARSHRALFVGGLSVKEQPLWAPQPEPAALQPAQGLVSHKEHRRELGSACAVQANLSVKWPSTKLGGQARACWGVELSICSCPTGNGPPALLLPLALPASVGVAPWHHWGARLAVLDFLGC